MALRNGSLEKESEMNIDIAKILVSPDRDLEIRKLISEYFPEILPKPWKHDFYNTHDKGHPIVKCYNCDCEFRGEGYEQSCPVPDPIALGWELAKQMLSKLTIEQKTVCKKIVMEIFQKTKKAMAVLAPNKKVEFDWWLLFCAEPTDYILAAIMAGEP